MKIPKAKRYARRTYMDALKNRLNVMDASAFSPCMDNKTPLLVIDLFKRGNIKRIVQQLIVHLDKALDVSRTDLILPKGDRIVTTYSNARHTPLPASTFEFTPPAGAHVTRPLGK